MTLNGPLVATARQRREPPRGFPVEPSTQEVRTILDRQTKMKPPILDYNKPEPPPPLSRSDRLALATVVLILIPILFVLYLAAAPIIAPLFAR